ncbi:MAG: hypothetical protein PF961_15825, partial [Planctomycetota bacterium]|nr:hypothetical protein [Planctomycetota bacterium]
MAWPEHLCACVPSDSRLGAALRAQGITVFADTPANALKKASESGHTFMLTCCTGAQAAHALAQHHTSDTDMLVAVGSRPARPRRRHLRWWRSVIMAGLCDRWFADSASHLRIYKVSTCLALPCRSHGAAWHDEILARACWYGVAIDEVAIPGRHGAVRSRG